MCEVWHACWVVSSGSDPAERLLSVEDTAALCSWIRTVWLPEAVDLLLTFSSADRLERSPSRWFLLGPVLCLCRTEDRSWWSGGLRTALVHQQSSFFFTPEIIACHTFSEKFWQEASSPTVVLQPQCPLGSRLLGCLLTLSFKVTTIERKHFSHKHLHKRINIQNIKKYYNHCWSSIITLGMLIYL